MTTRAALPRLLLLLLIIALIAWLATHRAALAPAALAAWFAALGVWSPVLFVLVYAVGAVLLFPAGLLSMAGGAAFGPVWGTALDLIGATLGAGAAFLAARFLVGDWVRSRVGGRLGRLVEGVEAEGWRFVAATRLLPVIPYTLANYALGLTRIGFWPYLAASAVCMMPGSVAYTWLGYAGRQAATGDTSGIRYALLAFGILGCAAVVPRMVRRPRPAA